MITALALAACSEREDPRLAAIAEGCVLNSDCTSPFVCAFRSCHMQCQSSRDCTGGARCVQSDKPFYVCQLPSERFCQSHADCPGGQVCGVDDRCRDECRTDRDCLSDQTCTLGTCADRTELVDGGLPIAPGSGSDGGLGVPCTYTSQCPEHLVCRYGVCDWECLGDRDCLKPRVCIGRRCVVPRDGGPMCSESLAECTVDGGAVCIDVLSDPGNCGACHRPCASGEICKSGVCTVVCAPSLGLCGGECRDLQSDRTHCGSCGNTCPTGKVCNKGVCEATCASTLTNCSGSCRDTKVDPAHCGGCNVTCATTEICTAGVCTLKCIGGTTACGGACRDTAIDPAHCGGCFQPCASGTSCSAGTCS